MGATDILFWVMAAHNGDIFRFALFMLASSSFALLCQRDSRDRRRNFFFVYTGCRIVMLLAFAASIYSQFYEEKIGIEVQLATQNVCDQIKEKKGLEQQGYRNFKDCYDRTLHLLATGNVVMLLFVTVLFVHFS